MSRRELWNGRTQKERVLDALRTHRRHGVTQVDFDLPVVIDGGPPIKRVAARVLELLNDGHRITDGGRRASCKIYLLKEEAPSAPAPSPAAISPAAPSAPAPSTEAAVVAAPHPVEGRLFTLPPAGPYDDADIAA